MDLILFQGKRTSDHQNGRQVQLLNYAEQELQWRNWLARGTYKLCRIKDLSTQFWPKVIHIPHFDIYNKYPKSLFFNIIAFLQIIVYPQLNKLSSNEIIKLKQTMVRLKFLAVSDNQNPKIKQWLKGITNHLYLFSKPSNFQKYVIM